MLKRRANNGSINPSSSVYIDNKKTCVNTFFFINYRHFEDAFTCVYILSILNGFIANEFVEDAKNVHIPVLTENGFFA